MKNKATKGLILLAASAGYIILSKYCSIKSKKNSNKTSCDDCSCDTFKQLPTSKESI